MSAVAGKDVSKRRYAEERFSRTHGKFPTFEEASVKLFNVVDFPLDGFPTKPISGSLGMVADVS
jgi:hypothetical protein